MSVDPKVFSEVTRNLSSRIHDESVKEHRHIGVDWTAVASLGPRWASYPGWPVAPSYSRSPDGTVYLRGLVFAAAGATYPESILTLEGKRLLRNFLSL